MKIVSWNVNGLRSPSMNIIKEKQFNQDCELAKLIKKYDPDILCLQETKCQKKDEDPIFDILPYNYSCWNSSTEKLGYSGVSVLSKIPFQCIENKIVDDDKFGRILILEFETFILINVYVPNSKDKDDYRKGWDIKMKELLANNYNKPVVFCGDLNVVSDNMDIYNASILKRGNSPGTKDYERANFKNLISLGYTDVHRYLYPEDKLWTWWDYRSRARTKDNGWRLDYFLVADEKIINSGSICKEIYGSDHCPIYIKLN
uniref:Endonuclease/exonuclease/phosphatase domain-containing protein n=1 Tax=viral metagenome TaxID=1070528 RepID=A0A6C0IXN6_9ZZZZ